MRKKTNCFNEKLNITISSKDHAHRKPFYFSIRKSVIIFLVIIIFCFLGGSAYIGYVSLASMHEFEACAQTLQTTLQQQHETQLQNAADIERVERLLKDYIDSLYSLNVIDTLSSEKESSVLDDTVIGSEYASIVDSTTISQSTEYFNGSVNGVVELVDWFNGGSEIFSRYTDAVIIDVETGLSFNIRRFGGTYHADCEPLTADDTAVMKNIFGGEWSWERRAVWVKIEDRYFAASIHGMPHMVNPTPSNDFDGHFCVHFLHSLIHETSGECPLHQEKIMESFTSAHMLDNYLK